MYSFHFVSGPQSCTIVFLRKSLSDWRPLNTALYLKNICVCGSWVGEGGAGLVWMRGIDSRRDAAVGACTGPV